MSIDYYFSIGSPWAYLGLAQLVDIAGQAGRDIRPFPVGILTENGAVRGKDKPPVRQAYQAADLARWASFRGLPFKLEGRPNLPDPSPAALAIVAADLDGKDWVAVARALHAALWERAEDIADPAVRRAVLDKAKLDGAAITAREGDADVAARVEANLAQARAAEVFGSPTYVVDGEAFWGQDRLDFVARKLLG